MSFDLDKFKESLGGKLFFVLTDSKDKEVSERHPAIMKQVDDELTFVVENDKMLFNANILEPTFICLSIVNVQGEIIIKSYLDMLANEQQVSLGK